MTDTTTRTTPAHPARRFEKASALALRLAHAENALLSLTSGQVDAIVDPGGHTYLLRPAQEHLRETVERLHAVIESAADVITVVNRGGVILSQSGAVRRLLGYGPEELVGTSIFETVREDDLPLLHAAFTNVVEDLLADAIVELHHRTREGPWRTLEATVSKLRNVGVFGVVLVCRDTARRWEEREEAAHREAALVQASLVKDRFLAMLAHELRTPLMPALLGVQVLQEQECSDETKTILAMIQRNVEAQARLLEELTDFATVGQHKVRLRSELIDTHEIVRYVLEICQTEIAAARIEVLLDLRASERMVLADSVRLQQIMWNLVKNAVKFSTPGSTIIISSANDAPGRLALEFVDHGVGIAPELLPLLFDPFRQGERSMQQLYGGLGLGMFIAKGLAEAQQCALTAASEGRGKGATFRLCFKTAPATAEKHPIAPSEYVFPIHH